MEYNGGLRDGAIINPPVLRRIFASGHATSRGA